MCNCIEQIEKANSEKFPDLEVETTFTMPFNDSTSEPLEVPSISGTYAFKNGKRKKVPIFPTYCPFCGVKYRE